MARLPSFDVPDNWQETLKIVGAALLVLLVVHVGLIPRNMVYAFSLSLLGYFIAGIILSWGLSPQDTSDTRDQQNLAQCVVGLIITSWSLNFWIRDTLTFYQITQETLSSFITYNLGLSLLLTVGAGLKQFMAFLKRLIAVLKNYW
jgi:hypothetical protein